MLSQMWLLKEVIKICVHVFIPLAFHLETNFRVYDLSVSCSICGSDFFLLLFLPDVLVSRLGPGPSIKFESGWACIRGSVRNNTNYTSFKAWFSLSAHTIYLKNTKTTKQKRLLKHKKKNFHTFVMQSPVWEQPQTTVTYFAKPQFVSIS